MRTVAFWLLLGALAGSLEAHAQARETLEPPRPFLLNVVRTAAARSPLGELRARTMAPDDIELRYWAGFGLSGTGGIAIRRTRGRWQSWTLILERCEVAVPIHATDTLSAATRALYERRALARCGKRVHVPPEGTGIVTADRVQLTDLQPPRDAERVWQDLVDAGLLRLPTDSSLQRLMLDGWSAVVEVRVGDQYRATIASGAAPAEEREGHRVVRVIGDLLGKHYARSQEQGSYHTPAP